MEEIEPLRRPAAKAKHPRQPNSLAKVEPLRWVNRSAKTLRRPSVKANPLRRPSVKANPLWKPAAKGETPLEAGGKG